MREMTINPAFPSHRQRLLDFIDQLPAGPYRIMIDTIGNECSAKQHRRYRSMLKRFCEHTGMQPGEAHELVCRECLPPQTWMTKGGTTEEERPSTSGLTTREMAEFQDRFEAWAVVEHGIEVLP